jgi:sulfite reductase beta subunit-like hemoprotein
LEARGRPEASSTCSSLSSTSNVYVEELQRACRSTPIVGGFISPKRWGEALPLDAWVPGEDIIPVCKSVLEAYRDLGTRATARRRHDVAHR